MMRYASVLASVLLISGGCTNRRSCKPGTALLTISFESDAAQADQLVLSITVNDGAPVMTTVTHSPGQTSGTVEVDFSGAYPTSATMKVDATALAAGSPIATGASSFPLMPGCTTGMLVVGSSSSSGSDMQAVSDGGSEDAGADMSIRVPSLHAAIDYATGKGPLQTAIADFNRDGHPDVAVANSGSNSLSVLLGNGRGGFGTPTFIDVTDSPTSIVTADFDGKNGPDLAVVTQPDASGTMAGTLRILLNDGSGKLVVQSTTNSVGVGQGSIRVADFDRDAVPDIVVLNAGSGSTTGSFSVFMNRADGSGGVLAARTTNTSAQLTASAIGDFDGVSGPDIAIFDSGTSTDIKIYLNDGHGYFLTTKGPFTPTTGGGPLVFGDFDGKKGPDLILANGGSIMLNDGTGSLGSSTALAGWPSRCDAAIPIDLNKDGALDVVCSGSNAVNGVLE